MQFKVKAKTMFVDGEAKKTRDHGEEFVVSATRYALMNERKGTVELIKRKKSKNRNLQKKQKKKKPK